VLTGFSWGQQRKDHFDDLGIGGWTVLEWVLNMKEGVERFYLAGTGASGSLF
jgi:hypothetical protein